MILPGGRRSRIGRIAFSGFPSWRKLSSRTASGCGCSALSARSEAFLELSVGTSRRSLAGGGDAGRG